MKYKVEEFITMETWRILTSEEKRYISYVLGVRYNFSYKNLIEHCKHGVYGKKYVSVILEEMLRNHQGG